MKGKAKSGLMFVWYVLKAVSLVPSVFWGVVSLIFLLPWAGHSFGSSRVMVFLTIFVTLSLMALPTILRIGERAVRSVPWAHQEAAYALGATFWEVLTRVTLPTAWPRLFSAILMGFSQALAESVVLLVLATASVNILTPGVLSPSSSSLTLSAIVFGEGALSLSTGLLLGLVKLGGILLAFFLIVRLIAYYSWVKVWCHKEGFHD